MADESADLQKSLQELLERSKQLKAQAAEMEAEVAGLASAIAERGRADELVMGSICGESVPSPARREDDSGEKGQGRAGSLSLPETDLGKRKQDPSERERPA